MLIEKKLPEKLKNYLEEIIERLVKRFPENLECIILYGSWAKGTAREESDIDLLVVYREIDENTRKALWEIPTDLDTENIFTLVPASAEDFKKEKNPLFTAVKKEGCILWGEINLTINPAPSHIKYAEYFERSKKFESSKVESAERILKEFSSRNIADLCFIASKHAVQMALAMKGRGYSSKVKVLLPLAENLLGKVVAEKLKMLFGLYVNSEYQNIDLTEEEAKTAIKIAKEILDVCYGGYHNSEGKRRPAYPL